MKRLSAVFFLSCICFLAQGKSCSLIYQSGYHFLTITDIERTDTATVIRIRGTVIPGKEFYLPEKLYLSDEQQRVYRLKYAQDVNLQEANISPMSGYADFSLVFEPLHKEVEIFDMRAANERFSGFAFWGIHTKKSALKKIRPMKNDICLQEEGFLTPGYATVIGQINGYYAENPENLEIEVSTMFFKDTQRQRTYKSPISSDGTFEFRIPLGNRAWARMRGVDFNLPVFMTPSDTLLLKIDNMRTVDMRVDYASTKGNEVMANLMKADPTFLSPTVFGHDYHPAELQEIYEKGMADTQRLADYLSWKYNLNETEDHLLRTEIQGVWLGKKIHYVNRYINDVYFHGGGTFTRAYVNNFNTLPEVRKAYDFLKEINTKDYAYFLLPEQTLLIALTIVEPVHKAGSVDLCYDALADFLGQDVDEEWRKRVIFLSYTANWGEFNPDKKIQEAAIEKQNP